MPHHEPYVADHSATRLCSRKTRDLAFVIPKRGSEMSASALLSTWSCNGQTTNVPGVGGDAEVLSPSPPNLATPFPTGRKSTAGRLGFFLPAGNSARIFLTPYLAYVLASGGAGKPPREKRRPGKISVLAKMCMKTQGLMQNLRNFREIASYSIKSVYRQGRVRGREKGGIKK